ncbi:MAG: autotransporter domain-containing protein [Alphaproteobacteria bacterium]|nr:autotransporter domain-containing protein [Alphaproteobacteria bacterium]
MRPRSIRAQLLLSSALVGTALICTIPSGAAFAQEVIDGGEIVTLPGDRPDPWVISGDGTLTIGLASMGRLTVRNGGSVMASRSTFLGFQAGATGGLTVDGAGSRLETGNLVVGTNGSGVLAIQNGAEVHADDLSAVGTLGGSQGTATVTGAGSSLFFEAMFWVGRSGAGTLTIAEGGRVVSEAGGRIGELPGSSGAITVTGNGSHWESRAFLTVGNAKGGDGFLTVQEGGLVTTGTAVLGVEPQPTSPGINGTVATVLVTGMGSRFEIRDGLYIGDGVAGTSILTVKDGGFVSAGDVIIGTLAGGTGILNIGAGSGEAASAPGRFETPTLVFGDGAGTLNFNHTGTAHEFAAAVSGSGDINNMAGTTVLSGDSSGFTGLADVTGGDLRINGTLGGQARISAGGTISGIGSSGSLEANAGSTIAPGDGGIGTLTVAGDAAFNDGATFAVDIAPDGSSDRLAVTGTTVISDSGTTLQVSGAPGDYPLTNTYTVLTSDGGIDGQFASVQDNLPDIDLEAIYQPDAVQLRYFQTSRLTSPKQLHPSAQAAALDASRLFAQTMRRRSGLYAGANAETRSFTSNAALSAGEAGQTHLLTGSALHNLAVWSAAMGETSKTASSGQTPGWKALSGGFAFGLEHRFDDFDGVVGLAGATTSTKVDSGASDADVNAWYAGAYGTVDVGGLALSGALSYAWQTYKFDRQVPVAGAASRARGKADGTALTVSGEAFYDFAGQAGFGGLRAGPLVTLETVVSKRDGFSETGAGVLNLTVADETAHKTVSGLGIAVGADHSFSGMRLSADVRLAWEHVFGDRAVVAASAIPVAGATFAASSAPTDRDRLAVGLGGALHVSSRVSAHVRYDGGFAGSTTDHSGSAGLTFMF